ncbi:MULTISPECIES: integrase [unclassified Rhodococcus (in: high G+C Gram-positive bacteria)]|uniref:integrase n=1 Tax=unclassified Rhodococcus (in: high G+C Gram-positive bacteria) TaxID=192944 RepID=UPI001ED97FD5|nr:integrase [Rhodococcus sp. DK17]
MSNHDASRPANPTSAETMPSVPSGDDTSVLLPGVDDRIVADLERLQSASTARNYRQDWIRFASWCAPREVSLMPTDPRAVADYVRVNAETRSEAGDRMYSIATLSRWVASINYWHRASGLPLPGRSPCVKDALAQARKAYRQNGDRPTKRAHPLRIDDVEGIVDTSRRDATTWVKRARERRDSALLLMGFAGAFRRCELSMLTIADVAQGRDGDLRIQRVGRRGGLGESLIKHVQSSRDHTMCACCAYRRWLEVVSAVDGFGRPGVIRLLHQQEEFEGHICLSAAPVVQDPALPVFRAIRANGNINAVALSGAAIHAAIRRRAALAGHSHEFVERVGGESLRAGSAAERQDNDSQRDRSLRRAG